MCGNKRQNIVFLDFDCVMIPEYEKSHAYPDLRQLAEDTAVRMDNDRYRHMDLMDISAFLLDCPDDAVEALEQICARADAGIVVSSSWCVYDDADDFKALLALRGLSNRFRGCIDFSTHSKEEGIRNWTEGHKTALKRYVILDDHRIEGYEDHQVRVRGGHLSQKDIEPALAILGIKDDS